MRQYAGFATAEESTRVTNIFVASTTGLSVAVADANPEDSADDSELAAGRSRQNRRGD